MDNFTFRKVFDTQRAYQTLDELLYLTHASFFDDEVGKDEISIIRSHLNQQIAISLKLVGREESADDYTDEFMKKVPAISEMLKADLQAIYDGDPAAGSSFEIVLAYPGFYAISVYRIAHELVLLGVPLLPRILSEHAHSLTGIDINPGASIGHSFFIDHGTGIVIGETCRIGDGVKLYQGVTLGALSTRGGQRLKGIIRHPKIENNVTIYAGASVLGNVVIGEGSTIGSNVFITEDIPAGTKLSAKPKLQ